MWNLKKTKQTNKENKNKCIDTEIKLVVTRGGVSWGVQEISEGWEVNFLVIDGN